MALPPASLALNDATSQLDRLLGAPQPEAVQPDGRSVAQLLAFAAQYGALIRFYDLADQPDGDWSLFFAGDASVALALQAGLDLPEIEAGFRALTEDLRRAPRFEARLRLGQRALAAIRRLDAVLHPRGPETEPLRRLSQHLGGASLARALRREADGAAKGWFGQFIGLAEAAMGDLISSATRDAAGIAAALGASMRAEGHAPQAALYNAFVQLFGHAQNAMNRFPRRLVDFYYGTILRQTTRAAVPDQVYLSLTPAQGRALASVPKGTLFAAGTDANGADINYAGDVALAAYPSAIAGLRVLRVAEQCLTGAVALAEMAAAPFPPFGMTKPGTSGALTLRPASLGFAIASPVLSLAGGTRIVTLTLTLTPDSLAAVTTAVQRFSGATPIGVLAQVMQTAFTFTYSSATGWAAVEQPTLSGQAAAVTIGFTLPPSAQPWAVLATAPDPTQPVLLASLCQDPVPVLDPSGISRAIDPYPLLALVTLSDVSIAVTVQGLTDLALSTPNGAVDVSQPFALFGSPPVQAASIAIAAPELFVKLPSTLSLSVTWSGLPSASTGFAGYYQGYVINARLGSQVNAEMALTFGL